MDLLVVKLFYFLLCFALNASDKPSGTYRAAVFEAFPIIKDTFKETIYANVKVYEEQIEKAAQQEVQIIVFPEYGLTSLADLKETRESMKATLPFIDKPETNPWNPCNEPSKFANSKILRRISCAAKENSIVVLINILTFTTCKTTTEEFVCRPDGASLRNSNVVFAADGSVLALYHKSHLYYEEDEIDTNLKGQPVVFDAGFAKFGSFICFDIDYSHPSVQYVKELGVNNLIFSTAWVEELPFFTTPQYYNAWARGQGVNFIASNMYFPNISRFGSGIFSADLGPLNYTYDLSKPNRLVIADIPLIPGSGTSNNEVFTFYNADAEITSDSPNYVFTNLPSSKQIKEKLKVVYENLTLYNYVFLESDFGEVSVCQGDACCNLTYAYAKDAGSVRHALIARDGPRLLARYNWSVEICAVVRCESSGKIETCGRVPKKVAATAEFAQLELKAKLTSDLIYPHILSPNLQLPASSHYSYIRPNTCPSRDAKAGCRNEASLKLNKQTSLLTFALYGKFYSDYKIANESE